MKFILLAALFSFLLALDVAFAAESGLPAPSEEGIKIADKISEELLLREDQSEDLPAKEEKAIEKAKAPNTELPLLASEDDLPAPAEATTATEEEGESATVVSSPEMLADALKPKAEPGTLKFEMATVDLLSDAQPSSTDDDSHEEIAKR